MDLTLQLVPGGQSTTVTIDQNNYEDMNTLIYNGFVAGSNAAFQPTITLSVAHNATASGSTVSIVASSIQFIRNGTNATLVSILEYSPSNFTQNITPAWRPLAGNFFFFCIKRIMIQLLFLILTNTVIFFLIKINK